MKNIIIGVVSIFLLTSWVSYVLTPPGAMGPYLNGIFPDEVPGFSGAWKLTEFDTDGDIGSPLKIRSMPVTKDLLIMSKQGEIWRLSESTGTKNVILDIKDRNFRLADAGCVGFAFHPNFMKTAEPEHQCIFVFYRYHPGNPEEWSDEGYNRLSKFYWDESTASFDRDTEEILIQQYDRTIWHNGGSMFFDDDGFLYVSLGDEGQEGHQILSNQRLDQGLFSGVIRIDIDNDISRSHPIIRQPKQNAAPAAGWPETFSQGYMIPNDNPWLDPNGDKLEEFFCIGTRSPYWMAKDTITGKIYLTDVGSDKREEINIIERAKNYQWPFKEGSVDSEVHDEPADLIGQSKGPFYEYDRTVGSCIIGGGVYHGDLFPELKDLFLFVDLTQNALMGITTVNSNNSYPTLEVLIGNIETQNVDLPDDVRITGAHILEDGRILVTAMGEEPHTPGGIYQLEQKNFVQDPPEILSELNVFEDLQNLEVISGILAYNVNAPLWSDNADKYRWIALPNDGDFNNANEQIEFVKEENWKFPEGTVFIKHFELPTDIVDVDKTIRLETRFFVVAKDNVAYGLTYKWNDEGTEAFLQDSRSSKDIDITEEGAFLYTQKWDFPSRDQCLKCHNDKAGYVLGVRTHQLNGDFYYDHLQEEHNQLELWNSMNLFQTDIGTPSGHLKSYGILDESVSLDTRIKSYLDANCASCHQQNAIPTVNLDFRYQSNRNVRNYINFPTQSEASDPNRPVIKAGVHEESEMWIRDASEDDNRMPPLASNILNQTYVDSLAKWIDGLEELNYEGHDLITFPNPSTGWLGIRVNSDWEPPYHLSIRSISGHLLREQELVNQFVYLDLTAYPPGTYLLVLKTQDKRAVNKFILY